MFEQLRERAYIDAGYKEAWGSVVAHWLLQSGIKLIIMKEEMKVNCASAGRSVGTQAGDDDRAAPITTPEQWRELFDGPRETEPGNDREGDGLVNAATPVPSPGTPLASPGTPIAVIPDSDALPQLLPASSNASEAGDEQAEGLK